MMNFSLDSPDLFTNFLILFPNFSSNHLQIIFKLFFKLSSNFLQMRFTRSSDSAKSDSANSSSDYENAFSNSSSDSRAGSLSRPPLERMLRIHQAISAARFPNATLLAGELEVSTKSIYRDIDFMRDRLALPIEYDAHHSGYFYSEAVSGFPTLQITEGELFAMLVAEKALQQYRGTPFERPLVSAFRKISASLPDTISLHLADWEQSISFHTSAIPKMNLALFDRLAKAASHREQLKLTYRKPGQKTGRKRIVDPYHLANVNGEWFLFAYCHSRQDVRTFAPARILSIELTGKSFLRPNEFSLQKRLSGSFGIHSGKKLQTVKLRFTKKAAGYIREKQWHPSQKMIECENGEVELSFRLSSLMEIKRWIIGWGGEARAIQPLKLKEEIAESARCILKDHI